MDINNKIALITGGASGIGYAYAKELLRNGAGHVAILDIHADGDKSAADLNAEFGKDKTIFISCDVTKPEQLEAGFKKTVDTFKGLDIVINNAGILNDKKMELTISINFIAVIRGTFLALQYMGKHEGGKGGTIVNVSSTAGLQIVGSSPIYNATKYGVLGLSLTFSTPYYYKKTGVRVLTMCPGVTETPLIFEAADNILDIVDPEYNLEEVKKMPTQKKENVALGMMRIIKKAPHGSVWVCEGGEPPYEVKIPDRLSLRVPNEN